MDSIVSSQSHIRDGRVRALAVTGLKRSKSLPEVPTFEELGVTGMDVSNWFGILVPKGTPAPIVERLNRELNTIVRMPDVVARFESLGAEPAGGDAAPFAALIRAENTSWKEVIDRAGIKPE